MNNIFDENYTSSGFHSQRRYPNTSLISSTFNFLNSKSPSDKKNTNILELGCGSGANIWMFAKEGYNCYGIDFSKEGIKLCHKMLENWEVKAHIKVGDILKLDFENNFFDVVYDVVTIQHLNFSEHIQCLNEAYNVLKKGGLFFSYHLSERSISFKSSTDFIDHCTISNINPPYPLHNNGKTCFISSNEYRKMLADCGFHKINIETEQRSYENGTQLIEYLVVTAVK